MRAVLLKVRRGETPLYAALKRIAKAVLRPHAPVPDVLRPVLRVLYAVHFGVYVTWKTLAGAFYITPLFRGRCEKAGKRLWFSTLPHVMGHTRIFVGDDVVTHGKLTVISGRVFDSPELIIGNRVSIGHETSFSVNLRVVVEDEVMISSNCRISDNDGHPRDTRARREGAPPQAEEVKPVRICRGAWIGEGSSIRKGVTIGEGAIVSAGSIVLKDVEPYSIVMGNPARVVGFAAQAGAAAQDN